MRRKNLLKVLRFSALRLAGEYDTEMLREIYDLEEKVCRMECFEIEVVEVRGGKNKNDE